MSDEDYTRQIISDCKQTFTVFDPGIRVLKWLEKICYVNTLTFVDGDPYRSAMREGMRCVYLNIQDKIKANLEQPKQIDAVNKE